MEECAREGLIFGEKPEKNTAKEDCAKYKKWVNWEECAGKESALEECARKSFKYEDGARNAREELHRMRVQRRDVQDKTILSCTWKKCA